MLFLRFVLTAVAGGVGCLSAGFAGPQPGNLWGREQELPLVYPDDFEQGAKNWRPADKEGWKIKRTEQGNVYSQFEKQSKYSPPHRSPNRHRTDR